ncbi:ATP-binding protein [Brucella pseudogrignonensis]|uniref:AAA family ATPase n=1 Tax=Brucella pseudogrignonensis TaxID=419475 RepID=UPI0028BA7F5A|nr:ATP-binding protein [Brucella pseudogrignonensis]MDT6941800.1 ATP-binding protein [Brucella pseudogrignonensis]
MTTSPPGASRLGRHLLARLKHALYRDVRQVFCELDLLSHTEVDVDGFFMMRFDMPDPASDPGDEYRPAMLLTGHPVHDLRVLNAYLGASFNLDACSVQNQFALSLPFPMFLSDIPHAPVERTYLLKLLRCFRVEPDIGDIAVCHLLARALEEGSFGQNHLMELSRRRSGLVIIRTDIEGFEDILLRMLNEQRLYRGHVVVRPLEHWGTTTIRQLKRTRGRLRPADVIINTIDADGFEKLVLIDEDSIGDALSRGEWLLGIVDMQYEIPAGLKVAADIVLDTGILDGALLNRLLNAVTAHDADTVFPEEFTLGSLRELRHSFREADTRQETFAYLLAQWELEGRKQAHPVQEQKQKQKEADKKRDKADDKKSFSTDERGRHGRKIVSDSRLIEPEPFDAGFSDVGSAESVMRRTPTLCVENLSGYGEVVDWALALKEDLALWTSGSLVWSDMSTRLLLSGPPGTGKTTFARALCNSLCIPVLATSIATWLRMGHLGDVLLRMKSAFEEAASHAPVILFIDEIDSIGQRQDPSRDYADYWNAVVNQLLELMDGAVRQEGIVIVGATNRPDDIDEALLRSGRLETHVRIPKPDTDALVGILAHHLGADLEAVLETRQAEQQR